MTVTPGRHTVAPRHAVDSGNSNTLPADSVDQPVLFLIGMRINKPWRVDLWGRVAAAMITMQTELTKDPALGLLGFHQWLGRTTIMASYWESMTKLQEYARNPALKHRPAWQQFMRRGDDAVGIWHETYTIGEHEALYGDMPPFGLGAALGTQPIATGTQTHRQRLRA